MTDRIPFNSLSETPWANGHGRKADIANGDGWSLAFAWLDRPAPFSDYAGVSRTITLVEGDGFVLDFTEYPPIHVSRVGAPASFDGGWAARCRLLGGPCFVLNAFSAKGRWRHTVRVASPGSIGPLRAGDFVVVLRGQAYLDDLVVGPRDSLAISDDASISGSADGVLATVRFDRQA